MTRKENSEKKDKTWALWLTILICILIANILARDQPSIIPYGIVPYRIDTIMWVSCWASFFGICIGWLFGFGVKDEFKWMCRGIAVAVLSGLSSVYLLAFPNVTSEIWSLRLLLLLLIIVGVIITKKLILIGVGLGVSVLGCYVYSCEYGLLLYSDTTFIVLLMVIFGIPLGFFTLGALAARSDTKETQGSGVSAARTREVGRDELLFSGPPGKHYDAYGNYAGETDERNLGRAQKHKAEKGYEKLTQEQQEALEDETYVKED